MYCQLQMRLGYFSVRFVCLPVCLDTRFKPLDQKPHFEYVNTPTNISRSVLTNKITWSLINARKWSHFTSFYNNIAKKVKVISMPSLLM